MRIKRAGLILATSVAICMCSTAGYAANVIKNNITFDGSMTEQQTKVKSLIEGYSTKLKQAGKFKATECINTNMNYDTDNTNSVINRTSTIDGNNLHTVMTVSEFENGAKTAEETSEGYLIKEGEVYKTYEITPNGVNKSDTQAIDLVNAYFPIKCHGDETLTLADGIYTVKGNMTREDYAGSVAANTGDSIDELGVTSGITNSMNKNIQLLPYECKFNAETGDLVSMTIDMSGIVKGIIDSFKVVLGDDVELNKIKGSMYYTSSITVDPTISVVLPANLK